ncbi:hypothetical protein RZS08_47425, partial [Arthrospira platensis SPKY1]|nr:hypothetical protein [Arthrospira platensis SPKY1]
MFNKQFSIAQTKLLTKVIDAGMLTSITNSQLNDACIAVSVMRDKTVGSQVTTVTNHYLARMSVKHLKELCKEVKNGSLRHMDYVSALYALGFGLPEDQ